MDIKNGLEKQLKVAELYKSQGLYAEAKKAYDKAFQIVESNPRIKNREGLLSVMTQRIGELQEASEKVESAPATAEMAPQVQTLIKNLFTVSTKDDPNQTALEGAVTLAKFGQIERAIFELNGLLGRDSVRVAAAKNILRCYELLSKPNQAVESYKQWLSNALFSSDELDRIKQFLEKRLIDNGLTIELPKAVTKRSGPQNDSNKSNQSGGDLDIGSIVITLDSGPLKGEPVELDVRLQAGNIVSLIIESEEKSILDNLNVGFRLRNIQFNSTVAIFRGQGIVSAKALIGAGPKQGNYHLDIKIKEE